MLAGVCAQHDQIVVRSGLPDRCPANLIAFGAKQYLFKRQRKPEDRTSKCPLDIETDGAVCAWFDRELISATT